ncbi:CbrC family protein [Longimicrobium sp.]|uniref:CbrC family protein n=1 Tax=Longimicrobium sp. TaxID=2029185 RepID=UPI002B84C7D4|nr:CbrC family protein [Longimicrobium sp.]HSU15812.1 CbrC family protein [Longimicrobium sp.]
MPDEALPRFPYHPDPLGTGSVAQSAAACRCCGRARGYIYTGPAYARDDLDDALCPWCIADGSASKRFDAEFTDAAGIGGYGRWPTVSPEVIEEVSRRTPGFMGWQQEQWWTCCDDAGEFLGRGGYAELSQRWSGAIPEIRKESGIEDAGWEPYLRALDRDDAPTAYVFRCRHCGRLGGYSDTP